MPKDNRTYCLYEIEILNDFFRIERNLKKKTYFRFNLNIFSNNFLILLNIHEIFIFETILKTVIPNRITSG